VRIVEKGRVLCSGNCFHVVSLSLCNFVDLPTLRSPTIITTVQWRDLAVPLLREDVRVAKSVEAC
jgi:hypothetical protein